MQEVRTPGRFLTAEWRFLAMMNYEIEPAVLLPCVPAGTELDNWKGKTFVSLVGFLFLKTRVMGLPIPFHRNFEEVNLRFYVRRKAEEGWRRGVVFIKEIVPRRAIAWAARRFYNENYIATPMRHFIEGENNSLRQEGAVEYGWHYQGRWNRLRVKTEGSSQPLISGSEEEFITEHYWGYAAQPGGGTVEYRVEHTPWLVWQTSESALDSDITELYGRQFRESLDARASSAFLAEGSPIVVRKGVRIL